MTNAHSASTPPDDIEGMAEIALDWHRAGRGAVLATVLETWGSAPRAAGSQLVVSGDGAMMGSVSGGCVEGAVVLEAMDALAVGTPRVLSYGVSDETAFTVGLACGGSIRILVEPVGGTVPEAELAALVTARATRTSLVSLVNVETGERLLSQDGGGMLAHAVRDRVRSDRSGMEGAWFVGVHAARLRLAIVGAVHIAQPLVRMARLAGYDPVLVDPRAAFGAAARFPGEMILPDWPDAALESLGLDARSAVVTLTHDPKLDDPAILAALASDAFYIGCLGSRKTHAARVARLTAAGISAAQIARIHAPVGLDIGARTPAEIAVSVLGQITQRLRLG